MKKIFLLLITILLIIPFEVFAEEDNNQDNEVKLYLFYSSVCTHCADEREFLDSIEDDYPTLEIVRYEVNENEMNYNFYLKVLDRTGINANGVPFTIIGTDYYVGYSNSVGESIKSSIEKYLVEDTRDVISDIKEEVDVSNIDWNNDPSDNVTVPVLGTVNAKDVSLPLMAIVLGTIDGFNPCAMWVLLFLITMLFNMKDRKKMWTLGIIFLTTSALVYLLFMAAWLKVAVSFSSMLWIRLIISIVAIGGGLINLNSYIKSRKKDTGCEVVNDTKRKRVIDKIKNITLQKKFILSILGIMGLAISVNLIELGCSVGLPLIFTQVLAINELSTLKYIIYLLIYIFFFLIDDIVIFVIAMMTLNIKGISAKYGKISHLIGGIIMLLIGILLILKPEWLMFNF